jgi:Bacterial protein of unknown function (DUF885)
MISFIAACGGGAKSAPTAGSPSSSSSSSSGAAAASPGAADGAFAKLVDDYFDAANRFSPSDAVASGFHEYDGAIEDRSRDTILARIKELHGLVDRLAAIDRAQLDFDNWIDATALEGDARANLFKLETVRTWEQNPMMYAGLPGGAVDVIMKRDFAPKKERLRSLVSRLRGVPAVFAAGKANVKNPPREFTDLAILRAKGSIGFLEGGVSLWARDAAGGDSGLLAEFETVEGAAVVAARDFQSYLEKDLLPRSKGDYALGAERFLEKLKDEELVDLPLADLLAKGEAQLAKDHAAFVATAKQIDATKKPAAVVALLETDHPTADGLLPAIRQRLEAARKFVVDKDLVTIPSTVRPRVEETPPYDRGTGFASMDTPGPYETKATEAFYYVEPVDKDWDKKHQEEHLKLYNRWVVDLINVHEVFPGHYVQFLYSPRFPTKVRKLVASGTNGEGWAHYAEQMVVDEGYGGGDPKIRLAQLSEALVRDCRYVVGIKLHTQGMTVEQGAKVFVDQCFMEPANAFQEARRGTYNPTYLYYTLRKLEIQKLRDDYKAKKGASLRDFHDAFVAQGGLPLPLMRKILLGE